MVNIPNNDFEREKLCYEQNYEQARSLNTQMNQIPTLAITLTGGLWFAAGLSEKMQNPMRFMLLIFAGLCDIGLVLAILRVRDVFRSYLEKLEAFHPAAFVEGRPKNPKIGRLGNYSMVTVYSLLMFTACIFSLIGAFAFYWPFDPMMIPVGIVAAVGILVTLYAFLFWKWKRTVAVLVAWALILAVIALRAHRVGVVP